MKKFDKDDPIFKENYIVAGTGPRSFTQAKDKDLLARALDEIDRLILEHTSQLVVVSGGAWGWDRYLTKIATQASVPFVLMLPCPEYPSYYWGPRGSPDKADHMAQFAEMEEKAKEVYYVNTSFIGSNGKPGSSNLDRNKALVDIGDYFFVWYGTSPGTRHAISEILKASTPYTCFNKEKL